MALLQQTALGAHLCEPGTDDCVKITTAELQDNVILGLRPETWVVWWVPRSWGPQGGGQTKARTERHSSATPTPRHWTAITCARSPRTGSVVFSSSNLADRMHSRKILIQALMHERIGVYYLGNLPRSNMLLSPGVREQTGQFSVLGRLAGICFFNSS